VLGYEVGPEQHTAHLDGIGSARGSGDRAHKRLVGMAHVRVHHVQVALVDRQVDRFAHRAAGMMQPRRQIAELDEIAEVLVRAVAAPALQIHHERRSVGGREHRMTAADLNAARGVACVLGELPRRAAAHDLARQP
jgi:hypothetical protein